MKNDHVRDSYGGSPPGVFAGGRSWISAGMWFDYRWGVCRPGREILFGMVFRLFGAEEVLEKAREAGRRG